MKNGNFLMNRKWMLKILFLSTVALASGNVSGKELVITPRQTEGPFYPDKYPNDTDNDLVVINSSLNKARGDILHISGIVTDSRGKPIDNAVVEIWQADSNRVYIHSRSPEQDKRDRNFQGFGRVITGPSGEYYFRTVMPVSYTMGTITRSPHIHFIVMANDKRLLTTQMYIKGDPLNDKDIVLLGIGDRKQREALQPECMPSKNNKNEYTVNFNIVLDAIIENPEEDLMQHLDGDFPE